MQQRQLTHTASELRSAGRRSRAVLYSAAAHTAIFLAILVSAHWIPRVVPFRLPGTPKGTTLLTYYAPGSAQHAKSSAPIRTALNKHVKAKEQKAVAKPSPVAAPAPSANSGSGAAVESGLGDGDISIALLQHFPTPQPDLSKLPHGTIGDVILNAVIDDHGKITELTLLKGLGSPVDEAVIATVREWSFTPATKNGVPVASEQELHFHYEHS